MYKLVFRLNMNEKLRSCVSLQNYDTRFISIHFNQLTHSNEVKITGKMKEIKFCLKSSCAHESEML